MEVLGRHEGLADQLTADGNAIAADQRAIGTIAERDLPDQRREQRVDDTADDGEDEQHAQCGAQLADEGSHVSSPRGSRRRCR